ncbi:MAG TPA: LysM domain-containing protein, partial [Candidatus Saccharibacteria bacterium]|nr:LysM domain-containing protein [Candidatus Saccharibacteria bacterium]
MRVAVLTGLFACALIFSFGSSSASAQASKSTDPQIETIKTEKESDAPNVIDLLKNEPIVALRVISDDEDTSQNEEDEVETKVHVVTENETLTIIAKQNGVSWKRLFDKNNQIKDPDYLEVGMEITIPEEDEELESRALP